MTASNYGVLTSAITTIVTLKWCSIKQRNIEIVQHQIAQYQITATLNRTTITSVIETNATATNTLFEH